MSAEAIHDAHNDLQSFYIHTYHLKDFLKEASSTTGISGQTIENAITNDPDLALLADLANLDKHGNLKNVRSGDTPRVLGVRGIKGEGSSWRLSVLIKHLGHRIDGIDVAKRALAAWQRTLKQWNLI